MAWGPKTSSTQRGYGYSHRKRREALLPFAVGTLCGLCELVMTATDELDLDHSTPLATGGTVGDRIVHRSCNRQAGAKLGKEMQTRRKLNPSRTW